MNGRQYNNVINWTLKHDEQAQTGDSLKTVRAIFRNMGIALPQGDIEEVCRIIKTDNYMGWKSCTITEAQEYINNGVAAIGINEDKIVVLSATDDEETVAETASVMTLSESTSAYAVEDLQFYSYNLAITTEYPYVDIPQDGDIGTFISYMGYHRITSTTSKQYKLKTHAINSGRYSIANPKYYSLINGRIVIATKQNIGGQLQVDIGDYVEVKFKQNDGVILNYYCIIGDIKGDDASSIWGHYDGKGVVEIIYHDYDPPAGYDEISNDPWGPGRVLRITKIGKYGNYTQ